MEYTYISSRQNPSVRRFAALSSRRAREEEGLFCAEGRKLCREAAGLCRVEYALLTESRKDDGEYIKLCEDSGGEVIVLSDSAFEKISADSSPDGIMFICRIPSDDGEIAAGDRLFILDGVRDPGNVGTILRSAAAFGYDTVILADCADVYSPKTLRASMGAAFKIKVCSFDGVEEVFPVLHAQGRKVYASALRGDSLTAGKDRVRACDCFIVGNEGHGVSDAALNLCDGVITIPMSAATESLNAAAAAAVLMWEYGAYGHSVEE